MKGLICSDTGPASETQPKGRTIVMDEGKLVEAIASLRRTVRGLRANRQISPAMELEAVAEKREAELARLKGGWQ